MSESLRDRVARVLCEFMDDDGPKGPVCEACYQQADALIAAGLVAESEWEYGIKWFGNGSEPVEHATREPWRTANDAIRYAEEDDSIVRRRTYKPGEWGDAPS